MAEDIETQIARRPNRAVIRRDQQVRRLVTRLRTFRPELNRPEYLPLLRNYARLSLLIERAYETLRHESLISPETGELRTSLVTIKQMMGTQSGLASQLGLTPTAVLPNGHAPLDATFERIERAHRERHGQDEAEDVETNQS